MKTPLIFDIKRTSTVDGPGVRTAVFFKGCNLDCFWCHNPEGKSPGAQIAKFSEKCIGCGTCQKLADGEKAYELCPADAIKLYGKSFTVDELFEIIKADKAYFDATDGGVTFSGGECMLYPKFLKEIAKKCKESGICVAIDTAGCVPFSSFEEILPYADLFLYDIKALDSDLHKRGTGVDNTLILENLEGLIKSGKRIIVRIPCIPEFNEGNEVERIKDFCKDKDLEFEVLTYHSFGESKRLALTNEII